MDEWPIDNRTSAEIFHDMTFVDPVEDKPLEEMTKEEILSSVGVRHMFLDIDAGLASLDQMREAWRLGAAHGSYFTMRSSGVSHDEAISAFHAGVRTAQHGAQYTTARREGSSHDEVLAAFVGDIDFGAYATARAGGATEVEILEAHALGIDATDYACARCWGATHDDVVAVAAEGLDVYEYSHLIDGQDHDTAVRQLREE